MREGAATESTAETTVESTTGTATAVDGPLAGLYSLQTSRRKRWALTAVAAVLGLALASVHWGGLVAGGALVGLCRPTLRRALVAGLGFGVLVLCVAAVQFAVVGALDESLATGQILGISVAIPLVAGTLGATVRGLVPDAPAGTA